MALQSLEDIIRALKEHPEWRQPLLEALLPERYQQLPERTDRLEEAVARLSETLERFIEETNRRFQQVAEWQAQTDRRLEQLTARVDELTVKLEQLTARVDELTVKLEQLTARVEALVERVDQMQKDIGDLKGASLEDYYRHNATAILGFFFRKLKVEDKGRLVESLHDERALTKDEWQQIVAIDLLVSGRHRRTDEEYLMVWEISWTVDESDVERALQRAELLRQRGRKALPVVAGRGITGNARAMAENNKVLAVMGSFPLDGTGLVY